MSDLIFSIDPSSTVTGWAVMECPTKALLNFGVLLNATTRADPYHRIDAMCLHLHKLLDTYDPPTILLEWTTGKTAARHTGGGAGLAIYGVAVGALWREAVNWTAKLTRQGKAAVVVGILENTWTRGMSKSSRQLAAQSLYSRYDMKADKGGDISDAIMLNYYYQQELAVEQAIREVHQLAVEQAIREVHQQKEKPS